MSTITLHFNDDKTAKRFHRNLAKGKGTVIKTAHIGGWSFGDTMKNLGKQAIKSDIAKNLAKKAISTVVNKTADFIDSKTGNTGIASSLANPLGDLATQQVQNQMDKAGQGMKRGRGRPAKAPAKSKKTLKQDKDLEIYNSIYKGGSFKVLGGSMVPL